MGAMETPLQLDGNTVFLLKGGAGGVFPKHNGKVDAFKLCNAV